MRFLFLTILLFQTTHVIGAESDRYLNNPNPLGRIVFRVNEDDMVRMGKTQTEIVNDAGDARHTFTNEGGFYSFVDGSWNNAGAPFILENDEPENSYGNVLKIIGGGGATGEGNAASEVIEVVTNNGTSLMVLNGVGDLTIPGALQSGSFSAATLSTSKLNVNNTIGPHITLKDTNGAGIAAQSWVEFVDSGDTRKGFVGDNEAGSHDITLQSDSGDVNLVAGSGTIRLLDNTAITGTLSATGSSTIGSTAASDTTLTIQSGTANTTSLYFGDTDVDVGRLQYSHSAGNLKVFVETVEILDFDANRLYTPGYVAAANNFIAGTTSSTFNTGLDIKTSASSTGRIYFSNTSIGRGRIEYDHVNDDLKIQAAGSSGLSITLDNSENDVDISGDLYSFGNFASFGGYVQIGQSIYTDTHVTASLDEGDNEIIFSNVMDGNNKMFMATCWSSNDGFRAFCHEICFANWGSDGQCYSILATSLNNTTDPDCNIQGVALDDIRLQIDDGDGTGTDILSSVYRCRLLQIY